MIVPFTDAELERLMDRPVRHLLTADDRQALAGQRVLITGAGGSIGSELARQIARGGPERLTLVDHSEFNLFQIERELASTAPGVVLDVVLGDVARRRIAAACLAVSPHVVFHAAACKHVTMMERAACAAVETNVLGTIRMVESAREAGARFVLISSDKAALPESVMGATKRFAELAVMARATPVFRPIVVRFGNVLGSSGSVLAIMRESIRAGRPIPLTDPRATRYVMTASEAVSLVIKAARLSAGSETYWLDMGNPVAMGHLAERLMRLEAAAGFAPVPLETIGLRPGEKLHEELTCQGLRMCRTAHPRIWVAKQPPGDPSGTARAERQARRAVARGDDQAALESLAGAVPEYRMSAGARRFARNRTARLVPTGVPARRSA